MMKSTDEMIRELHTVVLGVPGTDEKGIAKQVNDIERDLRTLNGAVKTNTSWRKALCWVLGIVVAAGTGVMLHILSAI
jgi:hypothetical protein